MNPETPDLRPGEVAERSGAVVLDVRETTELAEGRIAGSGHIPLGRLPTRIGELDRGRPVSTVRRSGRRSARATQFLAARATTSPTSTAA